MEIRILQKEEIKNASGLSRYVFDTCLRNRMEYPQTIAYVEEYIAEENLLQLSGEGKLRMWGIYEGVQMVAVAGMQSDGMITMLYVLPQCQKRGYGSRLLNEMREYAKYVCGFGRVMLNANPAWTSFYFSKKGFVNINENQDLRAPFVPMQAMSKDVDGFEKRPVPKKWIGWAVVGCVLFATALGCLFMSLYLF